MAGSIIGGLIESGHPARCISAADPYPASLKRLREMAPVAVCDDNAQAAANADVIILAVKPQVMAEASASIAAAVQSNGAVVISIAAGVTIASMQARLGPQAAIVRCMPNTPALLGCGASGLYANDNCSAQQREYARSILGAVGITCWVDTEQALDAVTALSGSGPAYFFLMMESMINAGVAEGLSTEVSTQLVLQTALGAAVMAKQSESDAGTLRKQVTSPGGTTQAAIEHFESVKFEEAVRGAVNAARIRSVELSKN
jgi:pyrroline-5-carboxylate reductase